ncbi:helicase [Morganella phage Mecenats66]|nr:helicase [Morganella phage Mecenats66]
MKRLMIKASIPAGAKWITVHPNGSDSKGQPVLVQPEKDGSYRVIGGAGGKLNYLKLKGVKTGQSYSESVKARQEQRRKERAAQVEKEKSTGVYAERQAQRKKLRDERTAAEKEIIASVASVAGWSEDDIKFPADHPAYAGMDDKERAKEERKWHQLLLKEARTAIRISQDELLSNATARADAGIGEIPLFSEAPESLSVTDLDPDRPPSKSLGFNPDYRARAIDNGLSPEMLPGKPDNINDAVSAISNTLAPKFSGASLTGQEAFNLVKQGKRLNEISKAYREAMGRVDNGEETQSLVVNTSDDADIIESAKKAIYDDLKTAATVSFLNEVGKVAGGDPGETMGGHIAVGAYESINGLAITTSGTSLIDRSAVDVLGVSGASTIVARRLLNELPPEELNAVIAGLEDYHVNKYMEDGSKKLKEAQQLIADAEAIQISDDAVNGAELAVAQALNSERRDKTVSAQRILGQTLGQMEANATLIMSLKMGKQDSMTVSLGKRSEESIVSQLGALGLMPDDYTLEDVGGNTLATITGEGMDKISTPTSFEDVARVKRNIDIISGKYDEKGWLPAGVASRADLAMSVPAGVADTLAVPFEPGDDMAGALERYIGSRAADGDAAIDILADAYSDEMLSKVSGNETEYTQILNDYLAMSQPELSALFDEKAAEFMKQSGDKAPAVNSQKIAIDSAAVDSLHRALADTPTGIAAYKQIGDLTGREIKALKTFLATDMAKGYEPAKAWEELKAAAGSTPGALRAIQDMVKSRISEKFVQAYNKINPDNPLKLGRTAVTGDDAYLGHSAPGFSGTTEHSGDLPGGYRYTAGHRVERAIAGMVGAVGQNFKPDQPTKLWAISMDGKYINQQRAVKYFTANKRMGLAFGPGSGKTNIMLGSFAELKSQGKIDRGLALVPTIVQGQFNGESLRLLEPGKFNLDINPGASREQRLAAYRDPSKDLCVMTHQSFRDDMLYLAAKQNGVTETEINETFQAMTKPERAAYLKSVMEKEGIKFDAMFVDEAHETLNRAGKSNSLLADVADAVSDNSEYYMYASGDPVKNDASEIYSLMSKLDPSRYADQGEFMRKYGVDTQAVKDSLKREMTRYIFPATISSGAKVNRHIDKVPLTESQKNSLADIDQTMLALRKAKKAGVVDIKAAMKLSPGMFEGKPETEHPEIAERVQNSAGIIKSSVINKVINQDAGGGKYDKALSLVNQYNDKQGVIFAKNRASIEEYKKRLEAAGKRVVVITGSDSGAEKERKKQLFNPDKGEAKADILVASDAAAVGMNLQSGQFLIQHDIPDTAKNHAQRNARIDRLGQKNEIDLHQLQSDSESDKRAYERLMKKYELRDLMASPVSGLDDTGLAAAISAHRQVNNGAAAV